MSELNVENRTLFTNDNLAVLRGKGRSATFNRGDIRIPCKEESFTMGGSGSLARGNRQEGDYETGREEQLARGKVVEDFWIDVPSLSVSTERVGYPTQKPLALLERIIRASSNEGDVVLDPFCRCATALAAMERLGRQWIGIDADPLAVRLCDERLRNGGADPGRKYYPPISRETPPERTDLPEVPDEEVIRVGGLELRVALRERDGGACRGGCGRVFDDDWLAVAQIDHIRPQSKGGLHVWSNAQLMCQPCNGSKGEKTEAEWRRARPASV